MVLNKLTSKIIQMARLSTTIEIFVSILACFILPQAFLVGFLIGLGGVITCFVVGHFAIQNPNAFWRGQLWEIYYMSIANRQPTIKTLIFDNFALVVLLVYAFIIKDSVIACGLLGIAAAVSFIILVQSFLKTKRLQS